MGLDVIKNLHFLENKPRKKRLFLLLLRADFYLTSEFLAKELEVTSRTVKSEIKELREELDLIDIMIESKRSLGYLLKISNSKLKNKLKDYYKIYGSNKDENDLQTRSYYILRVLLSHKDFIKVEDIQNRLFLNISLNKELQLVKVILNKYSLELIYKPHHGMKIEGDEFKKIMLTIRMYRYFDKSAVYNFGIPEFNSLFICDSVEKEQFRQIIFKTLMQSRIVFSDINAERFLVYLIYFRNRLMNDNQIELLMPVLDFDYSKTDEAQFVDELINKLRCKYVGFEFSPKIIQFLTYIAIFSTDLYRFVDCTKQKYFQLISKSELLRNYLLVETSLSLGIDLFDDYTCMKDLLKIMIPISLKVLLNVSDSIDLRYNEFKQPTRYPIIYEFLQNIYEKFESKFSYSFSSREKYLIFITICGVINRIELLHKRLNVVIIAIDGRLSTQQLKFNLMSNFSDLIERIDTKLLYELEMNTTKSYDLFVCFEYAKKLGIKYKPISFVQEEIDDLNFKKTLKKQFNKAYSYDDSLPAIKIHFEEDLFKGIGYSKVIQNEKQKNPKGLFISFNKPIILYLKGATEFFEITRYNKSTEDFIDIINISISIKEDKQKFKMLLNVLEYINNNPEKIDLFLEKKVASLTYSELLA